MAIRLGNMTLLTGTTSGGSTGDVTKAAVDAAIGVGLNDTDYYAS